MTIERTIGLKAKETAQDTLFSNRYRKLRNWMIANGHFVQVIRTDSEPFVMDDKFFGETFDEAVDTL